MSLRAQRSNLHSHAWLEQIWDCHPTFPRDFAPRKNVGALYFSRMPEPIRDCHGLTASQLSMTFFSRLYLKGYSLNQPDSLSGRECRYECKDPARQRSRSVNPITFYPNIIAGLKLHVPSLAYWTK